MQEHALKITVLGSGTSTGVPTIGCQCATCLSPSPYNQRTRCSLLLTRCDTGEHMVIDTTPDFRQQMLRHKVLGLEHVLYTHIHADHCHGFDDLRAFYFFHRKPINCYLSPEFHQEFRERFAYAFTDTGYLGIAPQVHLKEVPYHEIELLGLRVEPIRLPHGSIMTTGYRFGSFAYITDFKTFPLSEKARWKGKIHTMIASGVRFKEHPTHSSVWETVDLFAELEVQRGIITHLSHDIDYERDVGKLPSHITFAYDGMSFEINRMSL